MPELELLSCTETAALVTARGPKLSTRAVQGWLERHPDLRIKVAGRCRLHIDDITLILSGVSLAEVEARRRALKAAAIAATDPRSASSAPDSPAGRRPIRRQAGRRGARRPR